MRLPSPPSLVRLPSLASVAVLVILVVVLVTSGEDGPGDGSAEPDAGGDAGPAQGIRVAVDRVVDGDTIVVRVNGGVEDVRYIGVDTPESVKPDTPVECFALAASHFNERTVDGRTVRLDFDAERRDAYGRLLAYVYLGETFVNAELVRGGYATTLTIPPNDRFAGLFDRLEQRAANAGRGLWGRCAV